MLLLLTCAWVALASLLALLPGAEALERQSSERWLFSLRTFLERDPAFDPRLKVFALDDPTLASLGGSPPSLELWGKVLAAVAAEKPRVILIDKLFDMLAEDQAARRRFVETLRSLPAPVYAGGFVPDSPIMGRQALGSPNFQLRRFIDTSGRENLGISPQAYGPDAAVLGAFAGVGNLRHLGNGRFRLLQAVATPTGAELLPHLALYAAADVGWDGSRLEIDGTSVPLDDRGESLANLASREAYEKRFMSMRALVEYAQQGKAIPVVKADDIVLILPAMHTGHADWIFGPSGTVPGGQVIAALVNSVLTGHWLRVVGYNWLFAGLAAFFGGILAIRARRVRVLVWWILTLAAYVFASEAAFVVLDAIVPITLPATAFTAACLSIFALRVVQERLDEARMQAELAAAKVVQENLFPPKNEQHPGLHVVSHHSPSAECSGDFWTRTLLSSDRYRFVVGDATGHGVPAALVSAQVHVCIDLLRQLEESGKLTVDGPKELLGLLSGALRSSHDDRMCMTMAVVELDLQEMVLTASNAGHVFPLLIPRDPQDERLALLKKGSAAKASSGVLSLRVLGPILGMESIPTFKVMRMQLREGDRIVLYTDGLSEAPNGVGKQYGSVSLREVCTTWHKLPADELCLAILADVQRHVGETRAVDDLTLIVVEITAKAAVRAQSLP